MKELNILVVDDHDLLREAVVEHLSQQGHRVTGVCCAQDVDDLFELRTPDVYIIDLNLSGEDGFSLVGRIRKSQIGADIIVTTADNRLEDRIKGYRCGANVHLPKPVDPNELTAVLMSIEIRRANFDLSAKNVLELQMVSLEIIGPSGKRKISAQEADLLVDLSRAPNETMDYWQVAERLGYEEDVEKGTLEVRIVRLRKKLVDVGFDKGAIRALRREGYKLCVPLWVH